MKSVGIIGVGDMGLEMAKNLLKKGYELTAYDIREEPLRELAQLGARIAQSPQLDFIQKLITRSYPAAHCGEPDLTNQAPNGGMDVQIDRKQRSSCITQGISEEL